MSAIIRIRYLLVACAFLCGTTVASAQQDLPRIENVESDDALPSAETVIRTHIDTIAGGISNQSASSAAGGVLILKNLARIMQLFLAGLQLGSKKVLV